MKTTRIYSIVFICLFFSNLFLNALMADDLQQDSSRTDYLLGIEWIGKEKKDENALLNAYSLFEKVPLESAFFTAAFEELQKIHFKKKNWNRFFSYAAFYRLRLLSSEAGLRRHFRSNLISLELLALTKHCLWQEAQAIAFKTLDLIDKFNLDDRETILKSISLLDLHREFPSNYKTREDLEKPAILFDDKVLWRLNPQQITVIPHPKFLRFLIKSRCES